MNQRIGVDHLKGRCRHQSRGFYPFADQLANPQYEHSTHPLTGSSQRITHYIPQRRAHGHLAYQLSQDTIDLVRTRSEVIFKGGLWIIPECHSLCSLLLGRLLGFTVFNFAQAPLF